MKTIDSEAIEPVEKPGGNARPSGGTPSTPVPDDATARALVETLDSTGCAMPASFATEAKALLVGRDYFVFLFDGASPQLAPGSRHLTLMAWVASVVALLFGRIAGLTVVHVYALFLRLMPVLERDEPARNWRKEVWDEITWVWGEEAAKARDRVEHRTDLGNARRLVRLHGRDLRFCGPLGWLAWNGRCWSRDDTGETLRRAKTVPKAILAEASRLAASAAGAASDSDRKRLAEDAEDMAKWAMASEGEHRIRAMIALAESESEIAVRVDQFDRDPLLLTVANGTIDLRTGVLGPHRHSELITRIAPPPFDPNAGAPLWEAFLNRVTGGPAGAPLRDYLRRVAGYCLTGLTIEQCLFLLHGAGANGKTTFIEVIRAVLGDYALAAQFDTFLSAKNGSGHGPRGDVARLRGARLVSAIESKEAGRLNEGLVKQLTGGDPVVTAFKYRDEFEFYPAFKLLLAANEKPTVRGTDHGIWRRIKLVPFTVTIPEHEKDKTLKDKIVATELAGVLAWAVRGCLEWQRAGLGEPTAVSHATGCYKDEQDTLGSFLRDRCITGDPAARVGSTDLYQAYVAWAHGSGEKPWTQKVFSLRLSERGFAKRKNDSIEWHGVTLYPPQRDPSQREGVPPAGGEFGKVPHEDQSKGLSRNSPSTGGCPSREDTPQGATHAGAFPFAARLAAIRQARAAQNGAGGAP